VRWEGYAAHIGEIRNAYSVLVGNPKGKKPLGRTRSRCGDKLEWILRK
jgi:hypothetical protein